MVLIIIGILLIVLFYGAAYNDFWPISKWIVLFFGIEFLSTSIITGVNARIINNREVKTVIETTDEFDIYLMDGSRVTIDKKEVSDYKFSKSSDVVNIKWDKVWSGYTDLVLPLNKTEKIGTEDEIVAAAQPNCDGKAGAANLSIKK